MRLATFVLAFIAGSLVTIRLAGYWSEMNFGEMAIALEAKERTP